VLEVVVTPDMVNARSTTGGEFKFEKVFAEGDFFASGVLVLPKGAQKPSKNSQHYAMVLFVRLVNVQIFVVLLGQVQVQLNQTVFTISQGAQFFVPRGLFLAGMLM